MEKLLTMIVIGVILIIIKCFVIMFAWWAFCVPVFGLKMITLFQAFGLSIFINTINLKFKN